MMKKRLLILCKDLYFSMPCIKYSGACGWSYYYKILGIYIEPRRQEKKVPKWIKHWIWNLSVKVSDALMSYMEKNKDILKEHYYKTHRL